MLGCTIWQFGLQGLCSLATVLTVVLGGAICSSAAQLQKAPALLLPDERFKADLLVVVSHPDDETAVGSYLAKAVFDDKRRVAVVFATDGSAGGNFVGWEQGTSLGLIRQTEARTAL